jgi:hypothetical protein
MPTGSFEYLVTGLVLQRVELGIITHIIRHVMSQAPEVRYGYVIPVLEVITVSQRKVCAVLVH